MRWYRTVGWVYDLFHPRGGEWPTCHVRAVVLGCYLPLDERSGRCIVGWGLDRCGAACDEQEVIMTMLWVCLAGGLGAVLRFLLDSRINSRFSAPVPIGTLVINMAGSWVLGFTTAVALNHLGFSQSLKGPLGTGFCGGFTTFSTASVETARIASDRGMRIGVLHCLGMAIGGVLAAILGLFLGSRV